MNWNDIWLPDAEQELASIWLSAPDRDAVTRAAHLIDQRLQSDPENVGQPVANNRRVLLIPPLGVIYRVFPSVRRVEVISVWRLPTGNGQLP